MSTFVEVHDTDITHQLQLPALTADTTTTSQTSESLPSDGVFSIRTISPSQPQKLHDSPH